MKIQNVEGMSNDDLARELQNGGKFVMFTYTISIIVMTFKRSSDIYFVKAGESATVKGLPFTFLSLVLGWWGIPWGPIYTIGSLFTNLGGGKNVTEEVLASVVQRA